MTLCDSDSTQNSRSRLIEAAIFCFSEKGFDATGIREIAQRAQANSALVQYHFGGKEGLYSAALKFIFDRRPPVVAPPPEDPQASGARAQAIQAVEDILRHLIQELMKCSADSPVDQAALLLVTREMQAARSQAIPLVLEHIRPFTEHLDGCLRTLRPELDANQRLDMAASIYGPIFHLHSNLALIRIMRGDPGFPRDLDQLVAHFTEFSLRGIGIPEAFPQQGV
jgi:AcrR family transcriptional regulator